MKRQIIIKKEWVNPEIKSLSIKKITEGGPNKNQPEGTKQGKIS